MRLPAARRVVSSARLPSFLTYNTGAPFVLGCSVTLRLFLRRHSGPATYGTRGAFWCWGTIIIMQRTTGAVRGRCSAHVAARGRRWQLHRRLTTSTRTWLIMQRDNFCSAWLPFFLPVPQDARDRWLLGGGARINRQFVVPPAGGINGVPAL